MAREPEQDLIDKMQKRLNDFLSKDVSFPSDTDAEKFFKTGWHSTSSAKKGKIVSPLQPKNWSVFSSAVSLASAGATGVCTAVIGVDAVGTGLAQTTDGFDTDMAAQNADLIRQEESLIKKEINAITDVKNAITNQNDKCKRQRQTNDSLELKVEDIVFVR